jgi:hypothetical protein
MDVDINRIYKICHSGMLLSRNEGGAGQNLRPVDFLEKQLLADVKHGISNIHVFFSFIPEPPHPVALAPSLRRAERSRSAPNARDDYLFRAVWSSTALRLFV